MDSSLSGEFKKFFLIEFTEQLIRHSATQDISKLKKLIEIKEEQKKEKRFFIPELKVAEKKETPRTIIPKQKIIPKPAKQIVKQVAKPLFIPEQRLPENLEYLKPTANPELEMDLWKLNPLIKDPAVRVIEANPDDKVAVMGAMGTRQTGIILNKDDIDRVINKFSELSKIPTNEGVYKVAVGSLILSAIISEVVGSKFIIRKIISPMQPRPLPPNSPMK